MIHLCPDDEPCMPECPQGDCAGCAFPPRRTSLQARQNQVRVHEEQRRREREFAFEPRQLQARETA